jgi:hypothetical protein
LRLRVLIGSSRVGQKQFALLEMRAILNRGQACLQADVSGWTGSGWRGSRCIARRGVPHCLLGHYTPSPDQIRVRDGIRPRTGFHSGGSSIRRKAIHRAERVVRFQSPLKRLVPARLGPHRATRERARGPGTTKAQGCETQMFVQHNLSMRSVFDISNDLLKPRKTEYE